MSIYSVTVFKTLGENHELKAPSTFFMVFLLEGKPSTWQHRYNG